MSDEQGYDAEVLAGVARGLRAVLEEIDDPAVEFAAHPGTRSRLEGAALALEVAAAGAPPLPMRP